MSLLSAGGDFHGNSAFQVSAREPLLPKPPPTGLIPDAPSDRHRAPANRDAGHSAPANRCRRHCLRLRSLAAFAWDPNRLAGLDAFRNSHLVGFRFFLARARIGSPHRNGSHGPFEHFIERDEDVALNVLAPRALAGRCAVAILVPSNGEAPRDRPARPPKNCSKKSLNPVPSNWNSSFTALLLVRRIGLRPGPAVDAIARPFSNRHPARRISCGSPDCSRPHWPR